MKNRPSSTRLASHTSGSVAITISTAVTFAYLLAGAISAGGLGLHAGVDRGLRRRIHGVRDRGSLSLEQAIVTAVLSGLAIALLLVVGNAVLNHQNQIR